MRVLVVNAGSSSLKLRLVEPPEGLLWSCDVPGGNGRFDAGAVADAVAEARRSAGEADAVGHRIVHGGTEFSAPVRIDPAVEQRLRALTDLAPLHQPKSLAALDAVTAALPDLPAVACFDTVFHATLPAAAATYAVPREWRESFGLRRFGFHGLSHAYVSRRVQELAPTARRVVSCHLGAGASLAAILDGSCVDTTMGFTPLEGLVMATRSGSVDPGLLLWLQEHTGLREGDVAEALEHQSGLLALAGTADMREVLDRAAAADPDAALALAVYLHRLRGLIAAMTASLGGLDVLAFTGGVGERAPRIRAAAADGLGYLGVAVDGPRNDGADGVTDISAEAARARTWVIPAREDLEIARAVADLLSG